MSPPPTTQGSPRDAEELREAVSPGGSYLALIGVLALKNS